MNEDRLDRLRAFLTHHRSRLTPTDVGLPATRRRRVSGLRREEVAELAGVSTDWYRWFESGRPIRVSPPFLSRLADALQLSTRERRTLYHLALPELFDGEDECLAPPQLGFLNPLQPGDEVEEVLRRVARARDAFFAHDSCGASMVRSRIWHSWERSASLGADPRCANVPAMASSVDELAERRERSRVLCEAANPILDSLKASLEDSGYAIVTADADGCVLDMSGDRDILRKLSRISFEPGGDLSEASCGTNAIGTALLDERPIQVIGPENYRERGSDRACAAAPIRNPASHTVAGVLDVTGDCRAIRPEMISVVVQSAFEIEERMAELSLS